jgi:hypothetical protein
MVNVMHLAEEICAGAEIYYTGRTGGQYFKTAFILCDDYTELASKLYLVTSNPDWSEKHQNGRWKAYRDVLADALELYTHGDSDDVSRVAELQAGMAQRRERRNGFFHSAHLLDLSLTFRACIEAYCDLFEYCGLLFSDWDRAMASVRNLETLSVLFQLEHCALSDPSVNGRINEVIGEWSRNRASTKGTGVQESQFPEDLHLRMCVISGSAELRDRLQSVLDSLSE